MKFVTLLSFVGTLFISLMIFNQSTDSYHSVDKPNRIPEVEPGPDLCPYMWAYEQRLFPYMQADPNAYIDAINEAHKLHRETNENRLAKDINAAQWEFAGPLNVGGRVVDIEISPTDPSIIYAGFATGGVFKSTNKGLSWFPIFDSLNVLTIGDIGIDPNNPDILYVGTGEANGGHNNFPGGGIFKSTDAGLTWNFLGLTNTTSIGRIIVHPFNPDTIFLAAVGSYFSPNPERGVYVSSDGGNSWSQSLFISDSTGAIDIVMDRSDPDLIFAAMWERVRRPNNTRLYGHTSGVYRTTDGGDHWEHLSPSTGLPNSSIQNIGRIGLAISRSNPNILFALYNDGTNIIGLYKTTDYGDSWINVDSDHELNNGTLNFSWYFGQVRVHPANPQILYILDVAFMRSTNGGSSWSMSYQTHVDHHALAFNPDDPNWLIDGNDGGINISTNAGVSWSSQVQIPATQFYEIGLDVNNPDRLYGGTQDNGTNRTPNGGVDNWEHIYGGDGFYVIVDYTNPDIIYAESQGGNLSKSLNGGGNFTPAINGININEPTNWSTPVVMDPNNSQVLYYGTDRIYRTSDGAGLWSPISGDLTDGVPGTNLGTITTIAVATSNSNIIYAGTDDSHVWVTTDLGIVWTNISDSLPTRWVTRVVVDPTDENIIYVTFSGLKWRDPQPHIFRSTNMGLNWTDLSNNLPDAPVNAFAVDNNNTNYLYLGSEVGMYVSSNSGQSWEVLGEGLPVVTIGDIKIHPISNYLAVGTYGRSMYKIDLNQVVGVESKNNNKITDDFRLEQNYPNPFNPLTNLQYKIGSTQFVELRVYDIIGNEIVTLVNEEKTTGLFTVQFNASGLSSGVYFYRIKAGSYTETRKMLLLK